MRSNTVESGKPNTYDDLTGSHKRLVNATAEQKITALAAVLRPVVEQTEASPSAKESA